jgi:hypothetical protein
MPHVINPTSLNFSSDSLSQKLSFGSKDNFFSNLKQLRLNKQVQYNLPSDLQTKISQLTKQASVKGALGK